MRRITRARLSLAVVLLAILISVHLEDNQANAKNVFRPDEALKKFQEEQKASNSLSGRFMSMVDTAINRMRNLFNASARAEPMVLERRTHPLVRWARVGQSHRWPSILQQTQTIRSLASDTSPLWGGISRYGLFFTQVLIGDQPFRVQVDSGSSSLLVFSTLCTSSDCNSHANLPYDPRNSSSSSEFPCSRSSSCTCSGGVCTFSISYADQSGASGQVALDRVTVGSLSANSAFGMISSTKGRFQGVELDGIMGTAYSTLNVLAGAPTTLDDIFSQNQGYDRVYGMCLSESGGVMDVGGIESSRFNGDLFYTPTLPSLTGNRYGFFAIRLDGMTVGNAPVSSVSQVTQVIVDSGSTLIVVWSQVLTDLGNILVQNHGDVPGVAQMVRGSSGCASISRSQALRWPSLQFTIPDENGNARVITVPAAQYLIPVNADASVHCLGISATSSKQIVLGDVFMESVYTVFDMQNNRVGFATQPSCPNLPPIPPGNNPNQGNSTSGAMPSSLLSSSTVFSTAAVIGASIALLSVFL